MEDIAKPLPLIVIAEMLGLPVDDRAQLAQWSDTMMAGESAEDGDPLQDAAGQAWAEYVTYLVALLEDRRAHPRDDLISLLLSSADAGELSFDEAALQSRVQGGELAGMPLDADELLSFLVLLLVAGNETTRNALSGGMLALSQFPDERRKLAADLSLVNTATEEILRYVSPVISFSRTVTADTELRGRHARARRRAVEPVPVGESRRRRVRRSRHVPHRPQPEPAPRVRHRPAFLPRREPRAHRDPHPARGALHPPARHPRARGRDEVRGPNSLVTTIQHLPVEFTPAP